MYKSPFKDIIIYNNGIFLERKNTSIMENEFMMNEIDMKLFYEDSYIEEFEATVLSCEADQDKYRVVLDQTAFFPEGGGQYGDRGWLNNDIRVLEVKEENGFIYHFTDGPVEPWDTVYGRLDFDERFDKMQQHTGEHIVSGIVHSYFGYDNVGFHLGTDDVTMDFNGELNEEDIRMLEQAANDAVKANAVIETRFIGQEEQQEINYRSKIDITGLVRIVVIPGYDICACCAPHVRTTGEIGLIKITDYEKYKGGMRLHMLCGNRALADYNTKEEAVKSLSVMLSAKPQLVVEEVAKLKENLNAKNARIAAVWDMYVKTLLERVESSHKIAIMCVDSTEGNALRNFVNGAMEITNGLCCAFVGDEANGYNYVIGSNSINVLEVIGKLNDKFEGKGGGKPQMAQGFVKGDLEAIKIFLGLSCN